MVLILREEVLCAIILIFLQLYYAINKVKTKGALFPKIALAALAHVLLDAITVYTVNHMDTVPEPLNRGLHILFYISGVLFAILLYDHTVNLCGLYHIANRLRYTGYSLLAVFSVVLCFVPMQYVQGTFTNYSFGPLAFLGYGLFFAYCLSSLLILIRFRQRLDRKTRVIMIPFLSFLLVAVISQAFFTELLFTGAIITLATLGLFVTLENPDKDYMEQALWDYTTGLKNRNSYERDMAQARFLAQTKKHPPDIGFLVVDINNLKYVNDHYGHPEGDRLIAASSSILKSNLKSATNIYRMGGDEFLAVYNAINTSTVHAEMDAVAKACRNTSDFSLPICLAMGYTHGPLDHNVAELLKNADHEMYTCKAKLKEEFPLPCCDK